MQPSPQSSFKICPPSLMPIGNHSSLLSQCQAATNPCSASTGVHFWHIPYKGNQTICSLSCLASCTWHNVFEIHLIACITMSFSSAAKQYYWWLLKETLSLKKKKRNILDAGGILKTPTSGLEKFLALTLTPLSVRSLSVRFPLWLLVLSCGGLFSILAIFTAGVETSSSRPNGFSAHFLLERCGDPRIILRLKQWATCSVQASDFFDYVST